jgi:hypothetical protein
MAHDDMGTAFGCIQQAIAGIGETLCLEHASLLKVRGGKPFRGRDKLLSCPPHGPHRTALYCLSPLPQHNSGTPQGYT